MAREVNISDRVFVGAKDGANIKQSTGFQLACDMRKPDKYVKNMSKVFP